MSASILVLISGSGTNLQAIIDACTSDGLDAHICAVISNRPGVPGLDRARSAGIDALEIDHTHCNSREDYDQGLAAIIDRYAPDLIVLAGFMRILSPGFVSRYKGRLINIHPSLLPKYPGLHTHRKVLESGDPEHGATVHFVTVDLDGGPAIIQGAVPVHAADSESSLAHRVLTEVEHRIFPLAIHWCLEARVVLSGDTAYMDGEPLPVTGHVYEGTQEHV